MRVSVVNPTPVTPTVCNVKKIARLRQVEGESKPQESTNLSFGSKAKWGGFIGSTAGTVIGGLAGIGITVFTGGLGTVLIASMLGCAAGGIAGEAMDPNSKKGGDDNSPYDGSDHIDFYP